MVKLIKLLGIITYTLCDHSDVGNYFTRKNAHANLASIWLIPSDLYFFKNALKCLLMNKCWPICVISLHIMDT